jgi:hypothetical protein
VDLDEDLRHPKQEIPFLITYLLTELSPSWGATNCAATQELPSILWNPKVQYRVHRSPSLVPILSHINPIHTIPSYLSKIYFNFVHGLTSWASQWSLSSGFPTNILCAFLFSPFVLHSPPISSFELIKLINTLLGKGKLCPHYGGRNCGLLEITRGTRDTSSRRFLFYVFSDRFCKC